MMITCLGHSAARVATGNAVIPVMPPDSAVDR